MKQALLKWLFDAQDPRSSDVGSISFAEMAAAFPVPTALTQSGNLVLREGGHWRSPRRHELARHCRAFLVAAGQSHLWQGELTVQPFELWLQAGSEVVPAGGSVRNS